MSDDMKFEWNRSAQRISVLKTGGSNGMLFLANEAKRLMDPYVPANNLVLAQNVRIDNVTNTHAEIVYNTPYAHYQYEGILYVDSETGSPWGQKGGYKVQTERELKYKTYRHPMATSHWDKAMLAARKQDLVKAYEAWLRQNGKSNNG